MSTCLLFNGIAAEIWDKIVRNKLRKQRVSELTSTDLIIDSIQSYLEQNREFNVFVQKVKDEVNNGADMEVYIQRDRNEFIRILLQAKTIEVNGKFEKLTKYSGSTGRRQYDTLIKYGQMIKSPSYYLMFNGIPNYFGIFKDCAGVHNEKQFGCTLISPYDVKNHCETYNTGVLSGSIESRKFGEPWRLLTCCELDFSTQEFDTYSKEDIDMDIYFKNLFSEEDEFSNFTGAPNLGRLSIRNSNRKIRNEGWKPKMRMVISKYPMYKEDGVIKFRF